MEVVINIDDNVFTRLFDNGTEDYEIVNDDLFAIAKAIRKGTPLPKGHGKLIDVDDLKLDSYLLNGYEDVRLVDWEDVERATTIVEADKTENKE